MTEPLHGDTPAAISFLREWRAGGPWVLTSIPPSKDATSTETFSPETIEEMRKWIDARLGKENVYFSVNPTLRPMRSKAKKIDIAALSWLHVDVDPRVGEPIESERERALRIIASFSPPPTVIIDSGGGYQGFWKLTEEQPVNGNEARAVELEAYNLQIELMLNADPCHNIDRIMRLPGTINVPDAKKVRKGRKPALAKLVRAEWGLTYPLSAFTPAPRVQTAETGGVGGARVQLSGNLPKIASLDDLPERVTPRVKMLIVQGDDPDDPTKYGSRSHVVFAVACELVRAECSDDTIASILLDKDFAISGHVLDQPRPQEYAARQIRRAREEAINPMLRRLNEDHAVIEDIGGRCRIVSEVYDVALKRSRLSRQTFDDFRNRYMNLSVEIGKDADNKPINVSLGKYWLTHPSRRQYKTLTFAPGRETPDSYNLWRGFTCEARPGNCDLFLAHIRRNICSGSEEYYEYLLNWMARCTQHPDSPGEVAIVLRGKMGSGKGKFAKVFGSLWGRHFLPISNPKHLVGNFNAHLRDCVVLLGDEAFYAGDKQHESILKNLVTEEAIVIEGKGVDAEVAPNFVHIILSSNANWVVPAGAEERRYLVLDVADAHVQDTKYFAAIDAEQGAGGKEALLHMLLTRKLDTFEVRHVPKTDALRDQKMLSLGPVEEWWHEKLVLGKLLRDDEEWSVEVLREELQTDFIRYMEQQKITRRASPTALGKFLRNVMPESYPRSHQRLADVVRNDDFGEPVAKRIRAYFYELPTLDECRAEWDKRYGGPFPWLADIPRDQPATDEVPF